MSEEEPIAKVKAKLIIPKTQSDKEAQNKNTEKTRESFNMKNASNANTKITKLQEKNINGNYGRIYIKEDQKNNPIYSKKYEKDSDKNKLRGNQNNNTKVYTKVNNNKDNNNTKRYASSVDKNGIKKNKQEEKSHLRRKSIDRGGDYNNIMVTHIIYSSRDIDFHIIDPLVTITEEKKKKFRGSVDKKNRDGKNGSVRVTTSSSCDNIKIEPKEKKKNIGKSEVVSHRDNSHLKKVNNNKDNNQGINSKQKYSRPLNKKERK